MLGPTLHTPRVILRPPTREDLDPYAAFMADDRTARPFGGAVPRSVAWRQLATIAGAWSLNGFSMFSILGTQSRLGAPANRHRRSGADRGELGHLRSVARAVAGACRRIDMTAFGRLLVAALTASASAWGCNGEDAPANDRCRSQCGPGGGDCDEQPFESFGDLESGRATYQERCDDGAYFGFEAECADGVVVLRSGTGFSTEGRFYDPDSGEFLGLTVTSDERNETCDGKSHWPALVACREPVVTRVLCGTEFTEGQSAGRGVTQ